MEIDGQNWTQDIGQVGKINQKVAQNAEKPIKMPTIRSMVKTIVVLLAILFIH